MCSRQLLDGWLNFCMQDARKVYIPEINWLLMIACILVTVAFKTSDALVSAARQGEAA